MNPNIKPKLDFDPIDNYKKAKKDFITALNSIGQLTPEQQRQLAIELFGAKAINDFIGFIKSYNKFYRDEQNAFPKSERLRMKKPHERSKRKAHTAKQTLVKKDKSRLKNMKSMQLSNAFDRFQATVGAVRFSDNSSRGNSQ